MNVRELGASFVTGRPTIYRGIEMRSRLEARTAELLDFCGLPWEYEPHAFRVRGIEYLPDFRVAGEYLEVKPSRELSPSALDRLDEATDLIRQSIGRPALWILFADGLILRAGEELAPTVAGWLQVCDRGHPSIRVAADRPCLTCGGQVASAARWLRP